MFRKTFLYISIMFFPILFSAQIKYTGTGFEKEMNTSWEISLEKINEHLYKVAYPSLGCEGTWTFVRTDKRGEYFKEEITEGKENCMPSGYILLTNDPIGKTSKRFYIYFKQDSKEHYALGVLEEFEVKPNTSEFPST